MNYKGLRLESYVIPCDADLPVHNDVCAVEGCLASQDEPPIGMITGARIDGFAFCVEHVRQVRAYVEPGQVRAYVEPVSKDGHERITKLRVAFSDLKARIEQLCPGSRYRSVALTELETAEMWTIKAVVFNDSQSEVEGQS